jgi:hypothetical protein
VTQWRWIRGLVGAVGLTLLCLVVSSWWIISELNGATAKIRSPYNDLWWSLVVCAPFAILWFWYFARPRGGKKDRCEWH